MPWSSTMEGSKSEGVAEGSVELPESESHQLEAKQGGEPEARPGPNEKKEMSEHLKGIAAQLGAAKHGAFKAANNLIDAQRQDYKGAMLELDGEQDVKTATASLEAAKDKIEKAKVKRKLAETNIGKAVTMLLIYGSQVPPQTPGSNLLKP